MVIYCYYLAILCTAHALCDFPLQGAYLSSAKSHRSPMAGVPWGYCLAMHCLIHAGAVLWIAAHWATVAIAMHLALAEFAVHFFTDWAKDEDLITFNQDQAAHLFAKALWAFVIVVFR